MVLFFRHYGDVVGALTYLIARLLVAILAGHHSNASLGSVEPALQKSGPRREKPSQPLYVIFAHASQVLPVTKSSQP